MDKKLLGKKLNLARRDLGITSEKLAEACELNATYIRQIEAGMKMPSLPVFATLCKELNVSPSYLLSDTLPDGSFGEMDVLFDLWRNATPSQLNLITAMIKGALAWMEEQKEQ